MARFRNLATEADEEPQRAPLEQLQDRAISLMQKFISQNTSAAYETGVNTFSAFWDLNHTSKMQPVPEKVISWFIANCFKKGLATRTVKTYSAGINYWQQEHGHKSFAEEFRLSKV
ncbi:hypothetical protein DPMN_057935 [Dreissena polymorpha]|uniref:Integrase SAM-like N-terminal domain-containing protein n=1 Tax=Dreissena polymorpha TaxID=45954 RepID=A0A9D4C171_DREPO|nr:hypothetical protein DPMN_057935 [Dreissena polymorpha]